jgi:hypothetical protein
MLHFLCPAGGPSIMNSRPDHGLHWKASFCGILEVGMVKDLWGRSLTYNDKLDSATVIFYLFNNLYCLNHHWSLQLGAKAHFEMPKTSSGLATVMELWQTRQIFPSVAEKEEYFLTHLSTSWCAILEWSNVLSSRQKSNEKIWVTILNFK